MSRAKRTGNDSSSLKQGHIRQLWRCRCDEWVSLCRARVSPVGPPGSKIGRTRDLRVHHIPTYVSLLVFSPPPTVCRARRPGGAPRSPDGSTAVSGCTQPIVVRFFGGFHCIVNKSSANAACGEISFRSRGQIIPTSKDMSHWFACARVNSTLQQRGLTSVHVCLNFRQK